MASIAEIRNQYPQYSDMSDNELADALHRKHYSDMPKDEFYSKIGLVNDLRYNEGYGPGAKILQGATFDAADNILAGAMTPVELIKGAFSGEDSGKGFVDRLSDAYSRTADPYNAALDLYRQDNPATSAAMEIAGGVGAGGALLKHGISATRALPKVLANTANAGKLTKAAGLTARTAAMGVDGAALGAAQAFNSGQDVATGAKVGALAGAGGNLVGEGVGKVVGALTRAKPPKTKYTPDNIGQFEDDAWKAYRATDALYSATGVSDVHKNAMRDIVKMGYHPKNQPGAKVAIKELARLKKKGEPITVEGIQSLKETIQGGYIPGNDKNNAMLTKIVSALDDMAGDQRFIVNGQAANVSKLHKTARDLSSRRFKLERVNKALYDARMQAGSTGSGGNIQNATKQKLRQILTNEKKRRGLTLDEISLLEKVVEGSSVENLARTVGKLSPGGNGLMMFLNLTHTIANPITAVPTMMAGAGSKALADGITSANAQNLNRLILSGGKMPPPSAMQKALQSGGPQRLLGRGAMMGGLMFAND